MRHRASLHPLMLRARAQERASHRAAEASEHHDPAVARLIQEESHHKALAHVYLEAQAQHLEMQEALGEEVCAPPAPWPAHHE